MATGKLSHDLLSCSPARCCVAILRDDRHTSNPHKSLLRSYFVNPFAPFESGDVSAESDSDVHFLVVLSI